MQLAKPILEHIFASWVVLSDMYVTSWCVCERECCHLNISHYGTKL